MKQCLAIDVGGSKILVGEFGHIMVEENGDVCSCGKRGCLEAVASGRGVSSYYKKKTGQDKTAKVIGKLAIEGDKIATEAYGRAAKVWVRLSLRRQIFST